MPTNNKTDLRRDLSCLARLQGVIHCSRPNIDPASSRAVALAAVRGQFWRLQLETPEKLGQETTVTVTHSSVPIAQPKQRKRGSSGATSFLLPTNVQNGRTPSETWVFNMAL
jgi:hypothetical protein